MKIHDNLAFMFDFSGRNSSYDFQWVNTHTCNPQPLVFGFLQWWWKLNLRWQRSLQLLSLSTLVTHIMVSTKSDPKTQQRINEVTHFDCAEIFSHKSYFCCRVISTWKSWWMKFYVSDVSMPACSVPFLMYTTQMDTNQPTMTVRFGQPYTHYAISTKDYV